MNGKVMEAVVLIRGVMSESVRKSVADVTKQLDLVDNKTKATAAKYAALASAAAAAAGAMAVTFIKKGNDYIRTMNGVQAQTGITGDQLKEFGEIAQSVYASGKGENMQEIADALTNIQQASKLSGKELESATNAALLLKDTFAMETNETTRAATALMKNFGVSAQEAYGIIAAGAQNGANKNGDLLDTLNEYSVHYKALGLNADQFVTSLIKGAEAGSFSIDKVGDAVKEFTIRSKDGSKTSAEGFAALGLDAEIMTKAFAEGGEAAQAAFFQTVKALDKMQDPVKKNAAGVALFGTMYEDLEQGVLKTLGSMQKADVDAAEVLRKIESVKYNDIGYAITQIGRSFETALIPAAEAAGQEVYKQMPAIKDSIAQLTPIVAELGAEFAAKLPGIIQFITNAAKESLYFATVIKDNWGWIGPAVKTLAVLFAGFKAIQLVGWIGATTIAWKANTMAIWAKISAMTKDKAETYALQALYAKDAIIRGIATARTWAQAAAQQALTIRIGAQMAAQGALTVATGLWTTICTAATVATTAMGAAIAFLTSPIGIAIAAITAIIATGVLLYKNWDTVKMYAGQLGDYIGSVWTSIKDGAANMAIGVKDFFINAFAALPGILKSPINGAIALINGAIASINSIGFTIPEWVPKLGGKAFTVSIPNIPMLAKGGFTDGVSIAGEAGTEAVISFDPAYRKQNIGYLSKAAQMLGVSNDMSLNYYTNKIETMGGQLTAGGAVVSYNLGGLVFSPTVTITGGDEKKADIIEQLRNYQGDLLELIEELLQAKEAADYGTGGVF